MISKKDIVVFYTKARLESDVSENYMGYLWWILDPMLSALVYYVVFDIILHQGRPDYIPFVFIGIVAWKWFATCVKNGGTAIGSQRTLIKKVYLPKIIFPWIEINFATVKFFFAILFITLLFPFLGYKVTINHIYLPSLIICQFVFMLGISTFLASLTPFFPDFNMLITHLLRLAFYPSGILFDIDRVPERFKFLMEYNPMTQAITGYRNIIMHGSPPPFHGMVMLVVCGFVFYAMGDALIKQLEGKYAKLL